MKLVAGKYFSIYLSLMVGFFLSSCRTLPNLENTSILYTGAKLKFDKKNEVSNHKNVSEELTLILKPQPNITYFGIRPRLWVYYHINPRKDKGIKAKIRHRFAEPPVLLDTTQARLNTLRIEKYLQDRGYFHSTVTYDVQKNAKQPKAEIGYKIRTQGRYKVTDLIYPDSLDQVRKIIFLSKEKSLIQLNKPYSLESLQSERLRIANILSNEGYANFSPNYLHYTLDTLSGDKKVRIKLHLKDPSDSTSHRKYFVKNIYVFPNYSLESEKKIIPSSDTTAFEKLVFLGGRSIVRPKLLRKNILLNAGDKYSLKNNQFTLQHLQDLGVYNFVNLTFQPDKASVLSDSLNAFLYLTPRPTKEMEIAVEQDSRTGLFSGYGSSLSLDYSNRNLFKGAELLNFNIKGGIILQPGSGINLANSLDLSSNVSIYFPRFLVPFHLKHISRFYLPQTRINSNYSYVKRIGFYTLGNLGLNFGYKWKATSKTQHELIPISILSTQLLNSTKAFDSLLIRNPSLKGSFSNALIIGPKYTFLYQEAPKHTRGFYHYFRSSIELSGNLLRFGLRQLSNKQDVYKMFGRPFAQYSLLTLDYHTHLPLNRNQLLAFRLSGGLGIPYGNSKVLPYIRQFFIGGPASLRAFRVRTLGPGSYGANGGLTEVDFVDQSGDILLETNLEYRFPLFGYLKGALFLDGGNIWLFPSRNLNGLSEQEQLRYDQGVFKKSSFLNQMALGGGIGLRFDVDIFVLRFDIASPLRIPSLPVRQRWVINKIQPFNRAWLKKRGNLIFNVAIGYPF